jgi:tRNA modification GTPase
MRLLLARCAALGARIAEPGEFTRRAFLNGKLDLAQAESVADLIDAASATAARAAARSLTGAFSREVHAIVDAVTGLRMFTEATLDFPEEDVEFVRASDAARKLAHVRADVERLIARARDRRALGAGLAVVLVGRPNVGKSSLMNRLARDDVAIVTDVPGTTRDTVERSVEIGGIPLTVIDTAGLRDAGDTVEKLGIERTWSAVERADLALVLVDARESGDGITSDDRAIVARLPARCRASSSTTRPTSRGARRRPSAEADVVHVWLSALDGAGVDLLEREVLAIAGVESAGEDAFIARARHLDALRRAATHLAAAAAHLDVDAPPLELYAEELREAQNALASITGEFTADDLLGAIFSRFCIGK